MQANPHRSAFDAPHEVDDAELLPPVVEVPIASFTRLMYVRSLQQEAAALKAQQEERRNFRNEQRDKVRLRGVALHMQAQRQRQRNNEKIERLQVEHRNEAEERKAVLEKEKAKRVEHHQRYEEHGRKLTQLEKEQMVRSRAAVEAVRLQREAETVSMRTDLKEQKEAVDAANLASARSLVERVRADTSHEKIRKAKSHFVNARWDKADALRQELEQFKAKRRDQELVYLSTAVHLNQMERARPDAELARKKARDEARQEAAEVRRMSEAYAARQQQEREAWEERQKAVHEAMQGPKVAISDTSESLVTLFTRMFGFNRARSSPRSSSALEGGGGGVVRL